jgi:zinc protease
MTRTRRHISSALLQAFAAALLVNGAALAAVAATPPVPAPARAMVWPAITSVTLANGLQVVVVPLPNVPKVTVHLAFLTGRGTATRERMAVAELAAHVATEGTETRSSAELKQALRSIGGSMVMDSDSDATTLSADALSDRLPALLALVSDVARHPAYSAEEVELARANLLQQLEEERATPDFLAEEQLRKALFGTHPYGFVSPDPKSISAITRTQLRAFATAHYVPNAAQLVVVGDLDPDAAVASVRAAFTHWPRAAIASVSATTLPKRDKRHIWFVDRPGSVQSTILIGSLIPPRNSRETDALRVANAIAGGSFYSRLTMNIREAKGYSYSPNTAAAQMRSAGYFEAAVAVRNEVTGPAILETLYELDRMRVLPVAAEELASARSFLAGQRSLELESQSDVAARLTQRYVDDLPADTLQTFHARLEAVTAADVQRIAARYFDTYHAAIVIVGDYAAVKDQVAPFGDVTVIR